MTDPDALVIGGLYQQAKTSLIESVRYQIDCGRRLAVKKRAVGHGNWLGWLERHRVELGFGVSAANKLMRGASKFVVDYEFDEATATAVSRELWGNEGAAPDPYGVAAGPDGSCCGFEELHRLAAFGTRFGNIYADPPWLYNNQGTRAATSNHYEGMTVEQLCDPALMPIARLAAPDAHLHLWTTNGFLFECQRIFDAWGFEFRSSFVWVKSEIGIGNYWRNAHEFLLTGVRGNAKHFDDHTLRSWLECSRGAHSEKPDQVRDFIARASPTPRIELFARAEHDGWLSWGDQIQRDLFSKRVGEMSAGGNVGNE